LPVAVVGELEASHLAQVGHGDQGRRCVARRDDENRRSEWRRPVQDPPEQARDGFQWEECRGSFPSTIVKRAAPAPVSAGARRAQVAAALEEPVPSRRCRSRPQHELGDGVRETLVIVRPRDLVSGLLDRSLGVCPIAMLSPETANIETSLCMSPMVAISSVVTSYIVDRYSTTWPLLASGWVTSRKYDCERVRRDALAELFPHRRAGRRAGARIVAYADDLGDAVVDSLEARQLRRRTPRIPSTRAGRAGHPYRARTSRRPGRPRPRGRGRAADR